MVAAVVALPCAGSAAAQGGAQESFPRLEQQLYLSEDGVLFFSGPIIPLSDIALKKLFADADKRSAPVSAIVIKSPGGATEEGIAIGEMIRDRKLTIIVYDYCLSACANYIALAAHDLVVPEGAFVGFHGGALLSKNRLDELFNPEAKGYVIDDGDTDERRRQKEFARKTVERLRAEAEEEGRREETFLISLGLPPDFLQKTDAGSGISGLEDFIVFSRDALEKCYNLSNIGLYPDYQESSYKLRSDGSGPTLHVVRECLP